MEAERRVRPIYEIQVGKDVYTFVDVPLEKNALGKWTLTVGTVKALARSVCMGILVDKKKILNFAELEFLSNAASLNMSEIAAMAGLSRSMPSHWKSGKAEIDLAHSFLLKSLLSDIIIPSDRGQDPPSEQATKWRKKFGYPEPVLARAS